MNSLWELPDGEGTKDVSRLVRVVVRSTPL